MCASYWQKAKLMCHIGKEPNVHHNDNFVSHNLARVLCKRVRCVITETLSRTHITGGSLIAVFVSCFLFHEPRECPRRKMSLLAGRRRAFSLTRAERRRALSSTRAVFYHVLFYTT